VCDSLSEFLSVDRFSSPSDTTVIDRLSVNLVYFQANYAVIAIVAVLITITQSTPLALTALVLTAAGLAVFGLRSAPLMMNGHQISEQTIAVVYGVVCAVLLMYVDNARIVIALSVSAVLIVVHAALHKRSIASRISVGVNHLVSPRR